MYPLRRLSGKMSEESNCYRKNQNLGYLWGWTVSGANRREEPAIYTIRTDPNFKEGKAGK
ncbi:unnamed protein product [marine sediment metagenome]|uniref:Uncharacterized protein n=1 Tax=marine sediment metagenome TaxID=412755 RepID=X1JG77_9ZZZZ